MLGVELRVDDVRRHHRWCFVLQSFEGKEFKRFELGARLVDHRQLEVRIDMRVAVAGEVLDAAGHALAQRAAHPRAGQARDIVRVFAEASLGDDRVVRVVVDVEHRSEIPVEAEAAQPARHRFTDDLGERRVARGAERHRRRRLRQEGHANHRAALLVEADQGVLAHRLAQVGGELAHFGFAAEVPAEQAHRADVVLAQKRRLLGIEARALDVDHHKLTGMNVCPASAEYRIRSPEGIEPGLGRPGARIRELAHCVLVTFAKWRGRSGSKPRARASASTIG